MGYIDVIIPLLIGILAIASPETLVKATVPDAARKRSFIKKAGYVLILVAVIYAAVKFLS